MICFRADANEAIGAGHVMRCLSIARALAGRGEKILFVTADRKGANLVRGRGFDALCLDRDWREISGEAPEGWFREGQPRLLMADSYYLSDAFFRRVAPGVKTAYMDDLNENTWDTDFLINYNIYAPDTDYSRYEGTKTRTLLGPEYAPLREEFQHCPKRRTKKTEDVLVSAGGADPERMTERILEEICPRMPGIRFHLIAGALNPRLENIRALAEKCGNAVLHVNETRMAALMQACDMAVSAAGSTLYELCACGTPTVTYTLADNQRAAAGRFDALGLMRSAGDCRGDEGFTRRLGSLIREMAEDLPLRKSMAESMQQLVDGRGADRLAERLLEES